VDIAEIVARLREVGVEFEDVEVKRAAGGLPQNVAETMSAFANSRGGLIILGLDERSGFSPAAIGDPAVLRDGLASLARSKLTPPLSPSIEVMPFEGANLVLAEVEALPPAQQPCYVTSRGLYSGSFVRVGDGDQRLTAYEIDRLGENSGQPRWDEEPVGQAAVQDLDRGAVLRLIEAAARNSPRSFAGLNEADALARLGVLVEHDGALVPSLAGLLSVGSYPQQFFPQLKVSVTVYPHEEAGRPGPNGIRFLDSAAVSGPVPTVVTDSIQVVQRNLQIKSRVVGGGGSGIIMMISQIRKDTGAVPLFAAGLDYFRVTIPRTSPVTPELRDWAKQLSGARKLSQPQISALALAKLGNDVDLALLRRLGLSASEARRELRQLRDLDLLRPRNSRDESTYRLAPGLRQPVPAEAASLMPLTHL
jgi:predicted HTH transcriptional regulator